MVNTRVGNLAASIRDRLDMVKSFSLPYEELGTLANDTLARHLLERLCRNNQIFIDVGAHIGSVIQGVRQNSQSVAIVAIEAIPSKVAALRKRFPTVTVYCAAAGDREADATFYVDQRRSGYSTLDSELTSRSEDVVAINVKIYPLDTLVSSDNVDVIKIDVEGAELGVLKGSERLIANSRPTIMFESGAEEMEQFPKAHLWAWLDAHDYCILIPNRVAHIDQGLDLLGFLEAHSYPRRTTNYFAVARERRDEIRLSARKILKFSTAG